MYLSDNNNIDKFYFWDPSKCQNSVTLTECHGAEVSYFEILYRICIPIIFYTHFSEKSDHSLVSDYVKNQLYYGSYGISCTEHIKQLNDKIIIQQGTQSCEPDNMASVSKTFGSSTFPCPVVVVRPNP